MYLHNMCVKMSILVLYLLTIGKCDNVPIMRIVVEYNKICSKVGLDPHVLLPFYLTGWWPQCPPMPH